MSIHRRALTTNLEPIGDLEFEGIAATSDLQDDGLALDMAGADLSRFRGGLGPLLWAHDPDHVIGVVTSVRTTATSLPIRARFASPGASALADEKRLLLKDHVLNVLSIGFDPEEVEPISPQRPRDGMRATKWTLLEVSLVAVNLDTGAVITARSAYSRRFARVSAISTSDPWLGFCSALAGLGFSRMASHRRRAPTAAPAPLTHAQRLAEAAALASRPPIYTGNAAQWSADMRAYIEADALGRARYVSSGPGNPPLTLAERQAEAAKLAREGR